MAKFTDATLFTNDVTFTGTITTKFDRTQLALDNLAAYPIPLTSLRIHNAFQTVLSGTAGTDDLGLLGTAFGTAAPTVVTSDAKATTIQQYARFMVQLPQEYQAGETVQIRAFAGMKTTDTDTSATIDLVVYKLTGDGGITGGDICATAAIDISGSTTNSARDFTITSATLGPGDVLDCRIAIDITDGATGTAVIGEIDYLQLLCDVRG